MKVTMHQKFVSILSTLLFLAGLASLTTAQTTAPALDSLSADQLNGTLITFERTGCYGNCPAYKLTIHGDGRVEYDGVKDVKVTGKKTGTIDEAGLRTILAAFSTAKFFSVGDDVGAKACSCRQCTDMPTVITSISVAGAKHNVDHYHGCGCASKELWDLEDTIDRAVKVDQWTGDVSKAGPNGTTCWDPQPAKPNKPPVKKN